MNKTKRSSILWSAATSGIISVMVVGLASILYPERRLGAIGFDTLAAIVGAIATFGGIVTGLLGLYSLNTVDTKVDNILRDALKKEREEWQQQQKLQMATFMNAIAKYNDGIVEPDIRIAANKMQESLDLFPTLPLAAERIGMRFANATFNWAWHNIDRKNDFKVVRDSYLYNDKEEGDFRVDSIIWLERAIQVSENMPQLELALAKLYSLSGDFDKCLKYLVRCFERSESLRNDALRNLALFLWNCKEEYQVNEICKIIGYNALAKIEKQWVEDTFKNKTNPVVHLLAVNRRGGLFVSVTPPTSPTIYTIVRHNTEDSFSYRIYWYSERDHIFYPKDTEERINIDQLVSVLNEWFITIGLFDDFS